MLVTPSIQQFRQLVMMSATDKYIPRTQGDQDVIESIMTNDPPMAHWPRECSGGHWTELDCHRFQNNLCDDWPPHFQDPGTKRFWFEESEGKVPAGLAGGT